MLDSPASMTNVEKAEIIEKMKELIHKVPLEPFAGIIKPKRSMQIRSRNNIPKRSSGQEEHEGYDGWDEGWDDDEYENYGGWDEGYDWYKDINPDHNNSMKTLLIEYRKQLVETSDLIRAKNEEVPHHLQEAIKHISNQIGHWAGQQP